MDVLYVLGLNVGGGWIRGEDKGGCHRIRTVLREKYCSRIPNGLLDGENDLEWLNLKDQRLWICLSLILLADIFLKIKP